MDDSAKTTLDDAASAEPAESSIKKGTDGCSDCLVEVDNGLTTPPQPGNETAGGTE